MRSILAASAPAFLLGICLCAAAAQSSGDLSMEKPLPPSGTVAMTMNVGDLKIMPADGNQVRLEIHSGRPIDRSTMASWVRQFDVAASRATIGIHIPKENSSCDHCDLHVFLYLPRQADLKVDLGVGDLTIQGLRGDQDAHTGVGDLRIAIPDISDYGHVETHTRIGDIHDALNRQGNESGFLGKDENFSLGGLHHLQASTGIGDVTIDREGNS